MGDDRAAGSWWRPRGQAGGDQITEPGEPEDGELTRLLGQVALGDESAFERVYDQIIGPVYGLVRRLLRDPFQSEEVTQEVMVQIWSQACRYDPARGSALAWALTLAHRRAVDRVRSAQASAAREQRLATRTDRDHDQVVEHVEASLERERVRRCLAGLTELQRQAVTLAYYSGYTYSQVAELLKVPDGTIKTRMRDGLIRLRDCLGVDR